MKRIVNCKNLPYCGRRRGAKGTAGDSPQAGQRQLADVIPLGGGVPIMIGDEPIGAVGVSGSVGGQPADEACARAGVAAIAAQLK